MWLTHEEDTLDERVVQAWQNADEELRRTGRFNETQRHGNIGKLILSTAMPAGLHAVRIIARTKALANVVPYTGYHVGPLVKKSLRKGRLDGEGIERIDLEASSSPKWKTYVAECIRTGCHGKLGIWRHGAVWTPTRRHFDRGPCAHLMVCRCGHPHASARHYWAECPKLSGLRDILSAKYSIPDGWWLQQPRCTSKTGWITFGAATTAARRVELQIAACRMGIAIVSIGNSYDAVPDDAITTLALQGGPWA